MIPRVGDVAWIVPRGLNSGELEPMWNQEPPFISGVDTSSTHTMNRRHQNFQSSLSIARGAHPFIELHFRQRTRVTILSCS